MSDPAKRPEPDALYFALFDRENDWTVVEIWRDGKWCDRIGTEVPQKVSDIQQLGPRILRPDEQGGPEA